MTRRHPDDALISNPNDTAPPRRGPGQQSQRHGATQRTRCPAISMAQRHPCNTPTSNSHGQQHPRDTPSSNPHGTAAPTRRAQQQSPWHSAKTPIVTACHCVPRHSAAHATRPTQPAAAFQETSAPSPHPQIHGFPAPATISQRPTCARTRDMSHRATKTSDFSDRARFTAPSAFPSASMHPKSHTATRNAGRSA